MLAHPQRSPAGQAPMQLYCEQQVQLPPPVRVYTCQLIIHVVQHVLHG